LPDDPLVDADVSRLRKIGGCPPSEVATGPPRDLKDSERAHLE